MANVLLRMSSNALLDEIRPKGIDSTSSRFLGVLVVEDKPHFVRHILHLNYVQHWKAMVIGSEYEHRALVDIESLVSYQDPSEL